MTTDTTESVRLFYALWPDGAARAELMQLQIAMEGRKVRSENLHLTLAFLGAQPPSAVANLKTLLMRLPLRPMTLTMDRIGYFTEPHIAWAGMSSVPESLTQLQKNLAQELQREGVSADRRDTFIPHITLARETTTLEDFPFDPVVWHVNEIALIQSDFDVGGAQYRVLASRKFADISPA